MTDIILYVGEASPTDIRLNDPIPAQRIGIPIYGGGGAPTIRNVYFQALVVPLYVAAAVVATTPYNSWAAPLSGAVPVAQASRDFGSVPFASPAVITVDKWQQPLSIPLPAPKAQAGSAFVPYNTAQLSVNFTNFGWQSQPPLAPPVAKAQAGYSSVPYNTAQVIVAAYTNFWLQPLSVAVSVAKAIQGDAFVPYDTAQFVTTLPIALDMGDQLPAVRTVYHQANFLPPYPVVQVAPVAYTNFWLQPLSVAVPVAQARQGDAFVPFDTAQTTPAASTATAIPLDMGGAASRLRTVYYQSKFEAPYVAPVVVAGIAGIAWFSPLATIPTRLLAAPQGNSFVPFNTVQTARTPGRHKPLLFISNVGRLMT